VTFDKTIHNNIPNIVIRGNGKRKMIDIAVSGGGNVVSKEAEKI